MLSDNARQRGITHGQNSVCLGSGGGGAAFTYLTYFEKRFCEFQAQTFCIRSIHQDKLALPLKQNKCGRDGVASRVRNKWNCWEQFKVPPKAAEVCS